MKKVVASLQYGYLAKESGGAKFLVILFLTLFCFMCVYTFSYVGCVLGDVVEAEESLIIAIALLDILSILFLTVAICILVNDKKIRNLILSWQDDFVEITATVIDESHPTLVALIPSCKIRLIVEFAINGKKYTKTSAFKPHKLFVFGCYYSMRKLAGDNVPIYYSAKYDQVVFIKRNR